MLRLCSRLPYFFDLPNRLSSRVFVYLRLSCPRILEDSYNPITTLPKKRFCVETTSRSASLMAFFFSFLDPVAHERRAWNRDANAQNVSRVLLRKKGNGIRKNMQWITSGALWYCHEVENAHISVLSTRRLTWSGLECTKTRATFSREPSLLTKD